MGTNMICWWATLITLVGLVTANSLRYGFDGIKSSLNWRQLLIFAPPSICFAASKIPNIASADFVSGSVQQVIASFETVSIALVFFLLGRHKYSIIQWFGLASIAFAVIIYVMADEGNLDAHLTNQAKQTAIENLTKIKDTTSKDQMWGAVRDDLKLLKDVDIEIKAEEKLKIIGYAFCLAAAALMTAGGVFGEIAFKKPSPTGKKLPFIQQKMSDAVISLLFFTILGFACWPWFPTDGAKVWKALHDDSMITDGWVRGMGYVTTWLYIAVYAAKGVLTSMIVKQLDSTVKQVGKTASLGLAFLLTVWWSEIQIVDTKSKNGDDSYASPDGTLIFALCGVMVACLVYSFNSAYTKDKNKAEALYKELKDMEKDFEAPAADPCNAKADNSETASLLPK